MLLAFIENSEPSDFPARQYRCVRNFPRSPQLVRYW
jgi:hypothetical protein